MLVVQHHRFNVVADIMYRLGWSSRWMVEATEGKKRVEAANSHRNPQGFDSRGRSTTVKQGARKMITDMSDLNKPLSQTFYHFITSRSLTQPISLPTRYDTSSATILDYFLATPDIPITNSSDLHHSLSDHLPIHLQIKCAVHCPPP